MCASAKMSKSKSQLKAHKVTGDDKVMFTAYLAEKEAVKSATLGVKGRKSGWH